MVDDPIFGAIWTFRETRVSYSVSCFRRILIEDTVSFILEP